MLSNKNAHSKKASQQPLPTQATLIEKNYSQSNYQESLKSISNLKSFKSLAPILKKSQAKQVNPYSPYKNQMSLPISSQIQRNSLDEVRKQLTHKTKNINDQFLDVFAILLAAEPGNSKLYKSLDVICSVTNINNETQIQDFICKTHSSVQINIQVCKNEHMKTVSRNVVQLGPTYKKPTVLKSVLGLSQKDSDNKHFKQKKDECIRMFRIIEFHKILTLNVCQLSSAKQYVVPKAQYSLLKLFANTLLMLQDSKNSFIQSRAALQNYLNLKRMELVQQFSMFISQIDKNLHIDNMEDLGLEANRLKSCQLPLSQSLLLKILIIIISMTQKKIQKASLHSQSIDLKTTTSYLDNAFSQIDTGCKVIIEEESKDSTGGTQTKAAKKVFNFTEIKSQSPMSKQSPQGLNVQVKDLATNLTNQYIFIKEETNTYEQDICPPLQTVEDKKEVPEAVSTKKQKKGGFSFKIDITDSNIKD